MISENDDRLDIGLQIEPFRRELLLHCYRFMGSVQAAEDAVQDTMLRGWRHFQTFTNQGSGSLRAWLYTIATNTCLDALKKSPARILPMTAFPVADVKNPVAPRNNEIPWLEPFPDSWLTQITENPEARYTRQESISLAFLTALQLLAPRHRAILILSDVLDWRANEISKLLEISVSATNSALHRARVKLEKSYQSVSKEEVSLNKADPATNELLSRYVKAWEADDVDSLIALLKEEGTLSMPPVPSWYQGRISVGIILREVVFGSHRKWKLLPTFANGHPAFIVYRAVESQPSFQAFALQVLTVDTSVGQIADITTFLGGNFVTLFGYPAQLPE